MEDLYVVPAKGVILSASGLSLTNVFTDVRILKSNNSVSSVANAHTIVCSTDGAHRHYSATTAGSGSISTGGASSGAHAHGISAVLTPNVKRKILSAWSDASSEFNVETAMIALWESSEPPLGWAICNGSNGTFDFRDYFIELDATGNEDTTGTGNNTMNAVVDTVSYGGNHNHYQGGMGMGSAVNVYHFNYTNTHNHTQVSQNSSYTPPYYALYFVQKL